MKSQAELAEVLSKKLPIHCQATFKLDFMKIAGY